MRKICQNTGFSLTRIFLYKDRIYDSALIVENLSHRKPRFWHILYCAVHPYFEPLTLEFYKYKNF